MKQTIFSICTLFKLKKLERFLNITEYKIFLIKGFLICTWPINYLLLIYSSIWLLVICKYRDSNMFGNHFRILNGSECGIGMDCPVVVRPLNHSEVYSTILKNSYIAFSTYRDSYPNVHNFVCTWNNNTEISLHVL